MNQSIFTTVGGYPLNSERLQELQTTMSLFNALGYIAGNYTIIRGCTESGANVTDGVVFINGEVLEFKGGIASAKIIIAEETTSRPFKNGQQKIVYKKRYAMFGTGTGSIFWSSFKRFTALKDIQALLDAKAALTAFNDLKAEVTALKKITAVFTSNGGVIPFGKPANQIPPGWAEWTEAQGQTLVGAHPTDPDYEFGDEGGSKSRTVTINIPTSGYSVGNPADTGNGGRLVVSSGQHENSEFLESLRTVGVSTPSASGTINVLDPYRVVNFIHYTG